MKNKKEKINKITPAAATWEGATGKEEGDVGPEGRERGDSQRDCLAKDD
jgi:hypothetical protein